MEIKSTISKEELNGFVGSQKYSQFLQSWEWGEFQEKVGGKVWRLVVEDKGKLVASVKLIKKGLPMGKSYFYCARGPVIAAGEENKVKEIFNLVFEEIGRIAKEEGIMFLRFDPLFILESNLNNKIEATLDIQPSKTVLLSLDKSEEDILKEMHQKTRYNIKLAEKKDVKIIEKGKESFEDFWRLLDQTSGRDQFRPHGRNYYQSMLEIDPSFLKLLFAEYNGKMIAAGIFSFFGDTATYLHGGSSNENRDVMAPHLLQWQAIKLAKSLDLKYFDFHGIDEAKWPGVTRFKKGFGGEEYKFPGTFDLIYDEGWYSIYKMVRKVRRTF